VDEKGNIMAGSGGHVAGVKRTNSDMQQSTLSFASKKTVPVPSPVKKSASSTAKPPVTTSTSTQHLLAPSRANQSVPSAATSSDVFGTTFKPLGEGKETPEMIKNLEMTMFVDDEGLESDVGSEDEEETLVTPKKNSRAYKRKAASQVEDGFEEVDQEIQVVDANEDHDESNAQTLQLLGKPDIVSKGSKVRQSMMKANEEIARVRTLGSKSAASSVSARKAKKQSKTGDQDDEAGADKLNVKDKRWEDIYWRTHKIMGGDETPPIHCTPKSHTRVHHVLRVFDLTSEYGPCVGLSRLARWERAREWGLNPPPEVKEILLTLEGAEDDSYRETVFHRTGIYSGDT